MSKNKFYIVIIVLLLITNLALVFFMNVPHKTHKHRKGQAKRIVEEKLRFDKDQVEAYKGIIKDHQNGSKELKDEVRRLKNELYLELNLPEKSQKKDSLLNEIARRHLHIELLNYNHFKQIKKICRDDQLEDFEELTKELSRIFHRGPKSKKGKGNHSRH